MEEPVAMEASEKIVKPAVEAEQNHQTKQEPEQEAEQTAQSDESSFT